MRRPFIFLLPICLATAPAFLLPTRSARAQEAPATPERQIKPPELINFVEAAYPEEEKASGRQAVVLLRIAISEKGDVTEVEVAESASPAFDAAAAAAAKQFRFSPAEIDGVPSPVRIFYRYEFVLKQELPTTGDLTGLVRNRKTKAPLAGARLHVGDQEAVTDAQGRFSFVGLPPKAHPIELSGEGFTSLRTEETVEAGKAVDVIYEVTLQEAEEEGESDDLELVVVAPPLKKSIASVQITADQGRRVAGTQGDVLKVVENMPGVARSAVGSGALVVWGASPQDTRVYVDGVRLPALYHMGALRSVLNTDFVSGIEIVPGGYGASFGRGLGGLISVNTKPLDEKGNHGVAAVDVIDAQVGTRVDLSNNARGAIYVRRSHLADAFNLVSDRDVGDLFPLPRFWDGQARLRFDLGPQEYVSVTGLFSTDQVKRRVATGDPAFEKADERQLTFYRLSGRYEKILGEGRSVSLTPWVGRDQHRLENRFGAVPASQESTSTLIGFRGSYRTRPRKWLGLTLGLDAEFESIDLKRRGSVSVPPREGDVRLFGQPPPDQVNADDWNVAILSPATFLEAEVDVVPERLKLLPGLRVEPFMFSVSRSTPPEGDTPSVGLYELTTGVQPRVATQWRVTDAWSVSAAWGIYRQPAGPEDLSATFGNPSLPLSRGTHYVLGTALKLGESLSAELTGFASRTDQLAMRSPEQSPQLARALLPTGEGGVNGVQALLRADALGPFFGWISYSLLKSERIDAPGRPARLFDFDQRHILTIVGTYKLGAGFEIGTRFRLSSGFPRTPIVSRTFDTRRDIYQPVFGQQNSIRLPTFAQLDLRLSRQMKIAGTELEAYLDVQNVTNRNNGEEYVYSSDLVVRRTIRGLPLLPVAGVRWSW